MNKKNLTTTTYCILTRLIISWKPQTSEALDKGVHLYRFHVDIIFIVILLFLLNEVDRDPNKDSFSFSYCNFLFLSSIRP